MISRAGRPRYLARPASSTPGRRTPPHRLQRRAASPYRQTANQPTRQSTSDGQIGVEPGSSAGKSPAAPHARVLEHPTRQPQQSKDWTTEPRRPAGRKL